MNKNYPTYEEHQRAWEELASGIASIREEVREVEEGEIPLNSKPGSLTIIGTGIETIGIAVGDIKLIEDADKVLFCVADPATIVWLKRLRPDALDLYVLYGENKVLDSMTAYTASQDQPKAYTSLGAATYNGQTLPIKVGASVALKYIAKIS